MKFGLMIISLLFSMSTWADEAPVAKNNEGVSVEKATEKATLNESQIALNLEAPKSAATSENPFFKMIMTLSVIGVFATGGILYLKRAGFKTSKLKANQIKILTQYHLGPKKSLAIVRVAGESILVGITDQNISHIKTLSLLDEDIPEATPSQFGDLLDQETSPASKRTVVAKVNTDEEEFSMHGIKDIVSQKMKNMRSLQ